MDTIRFPAFEIPIPPSGNALYDQKVIANRPGVKPKFMVLKFPTEDYKRWLDQISPILRSNWRKIEPPLLVHVRIYGGQGFRVNRDWDNVLKSLGDSFRIHEFQDYLPGRKTKKREFGAGILSDDHVRIIKGWHVEYFTTDEHMSILGANAPARKEDLIARCYLQFLPSPKIDHVQSGLFAPSATRE